ncbi:endonuclease/exonuclease/phosphatase family protein [Verticillium alfalfae VaMs.102]|uniref:Endonuclease/exonuclease/phosphatase family protein n=1 Tax=Verticillium alfalfae (strain VaMs.102 / ATCC MYA-4576 / FGSC 10136) TaxID=526221 RepID=C9SWI0_VERA1|nr:endonuclease/exonuclease/phosphatase family protein [Verticillium alfalfae VaMs.102]EEY23145.1 endonuclease/exonuclease/phosphatase family protein [Verticillium alfalfae VaMs.102]
MKFSVVVAPLALLLNAVAISAQGTQAVRAVTFNIRYDAGSRESGEKPWWDAFCWASASRCRQPHVINQLSQIAAGAPSGAVTVIGLQEVLNNQLNDIKNGLGSGWSHIGVGRDDGRTNGEFSPILYRPAALRVLFSETKWLSPTPDVVSFGWGAGSRRVVTLAVFESVTTGKRFITPTRTSTTLAGDAYQTLLNSGYAQDLYNLATPAQRIGPYGNTYTTFTAGAPTSRIDFIWLGPVADRRYSVQRYEILSNEASGMLFSDHRAVVGDVTLL